MANEVGNQYAPPRSSVADVGGDVGTVKAARSARLLAVILDGFIGFICFVPAYAVNFTAIAQQARGNPVGVWIAVAKAGGWFYFGLVAAMAVLVIDLVLMARDGQTIGKKLVGIKVVRVDGSKVSLFRIFVVRYVFNTFLTLIPFFGTLYSLVDCLMIFGEPRRCAHDYLADTIVIKA
jgi:uncharacterized RDD family membrane protein YckC